MPLRGVFVYCRWLFFRITHHKQTYLFEQAPKGIPFFPPGLGEAETRFEKSACVDYQRNGVPRGTRFQTNAMYDRGFFFAGSLRRPAIAEHTDENTNTTNVRAFFFLP